MYIKKNNNEFVFPADSYLSNKVHENDRITLENPKFWGVILFSLLYFTIEESRANFFFMVEDYFL